MEMGFTRNTARVTLTLYTVLCSPDFIKYFHSYIRWCGVRTSDIRYTIWFRAARIYLYIGVSTTMPFDSAEPNSGASRSTIKPHREESLIVLPTRSDINVGPQPRPQTRRGYTRLGRQWLFCSLQRNNDMSNSGDIGMWRTAILDVHAATRRMPATIIWLLHGTCQEVLWMAPPVRLVTSARFLFCTHTLQT